MESTLIKLTKEETSAVIVGIQLTNEDDHLDRDLDELESLLTTLGIETKGRVIQRRHKLTAKHLLGAGKVEEIRDIVAENECSLVVFDHPLSGPQIRNIEEITCCQVLDRAGVILDIFARHAKTNQAKIQVEIAQLEYLLPRLTGAWTHFQKQAGAGMAGRGMGEKQIEIDRRRARERIAKLQKRLEHIRKERQTQRKSRQKELKVSIVGYTNSGKTTLMKSLTKATSDGKDELFATLDANVRTIDPNTRPKILLTDTVGFIRNLPHSLVDSFKSTLEEAVEADFLLHVVDVSHPNYTDQKEITEKVLEEVGAGRVPTVLVFNKIDQLEDPFLKKILHKKYEHSIVVSAYNEDDMILLRDHIYNFFEAQFKEAKLVVATTNQAVLSQVYQHCMVLDEDYEQEGVVRFKVRAPEGTINKLAQYVLGNESSLEEEY